MTDIYHSGTLDESLGYGSGVGQTDRLMKGPRFVAGFGLAVLRDMLF